MFTIGIEFVSSFERNFTISFTMGKQVTQFRTVEIYNFDNGEEEKLIEVQNYSTSVLFS